ncbi:hypothetical protein GCM10022380_41580 [Amycolatopsis tucumanensis]|uniref:Uncharacterized protein n=1 Tax=Amycolatopsis tucumanensis TaxID=401106 RepID=A0ABP7IHH5_9PSEU
MLYALTGFAWFFAAQNAVWWYSRACHIPNGPAGPPHLGNAARRLAGHGAGRLRGAPPAPAVVATPARLGSGPRVLKIAGVSAPL